MGNNNLESTEKKFPWINLLPIAIAVCNPDSLEIVACNELFSGIARLKADIPNKITNFLDIERENCLVKNCPVKLATALNGQKTLIMNSDAVEVEGESYLICAFTDASSNSGEGIKLGVDMSASDKIDTMTGIYNKEYGYTLLNEVIQQSGENISTICYLTINDLKKVKDDFGQAIGDEYVMSVVSVLKAATRQSDFFARLDGDEFLVIFPKCRYEIVETIMDTVMNKLEVINKTSENEYETSISFGIIELLPGKFEDADRAVSSAISTMQSMRNEYYER